MARKFGPTKGEHIFRVFAGLFVLGLIAAAFIVKGLPEGLVVSESFLFGGAFAAFLVVNSSYRLWKADYRIPQPRSKG